MKTFIPENLPVPVLHGHLLSAIAPRPIAFASTVDKQGNVNLSPFSFFNVFGANPPLLIFSPARRVRDNTLKHTLENVKEVPEVVINVVNYAIVEQMSLASTEYEKGVNEFVKAGFTPLASEAVRPPRVKESPVQLECKVEQIIETGTEGGAGNLIICRVVRLHIAPEVLNEAGRIDPHKIDLVARMGGDFYCRASGAALFEVEKPLAKKGIGIDALPLEIRQSSVLTGNSLAKLANIETLPALSTLTPTAENPTALTKEERHALAQQYLEKGDTMAAWYVLLA
ncbi:flavin reductase family protein [Hugenholtzia roseola]|uniref:flavin reductase family protein n=1 Tax=Hugenholtzia roseola TaxID=1002 RepID=UPI0003FE8466|nr:flavin reductase family protein [Hugenholtzia roseola]